MAGQAGMNKESCMFPASFLCSYKYFQASRACKLDCKDRTLSEQELSKYTRLFNKVRNGFFLTACMVTNFAQPPR